MAEEDLSFTAYYLGSTWSSKGQFSVEGSLDHSFNKRNWLAVSGLTASGADESDGQPGLDTRGIDIDFGQRLEPFSWRIGAGWLGDSGLAETHRLQLGLGYERPRWQLDASFEHRTINYELESFAGLLRALDRLLEAGLRAELESRFPGVQFGDLIELNAELDLNTQIYGLDLSYNLLDQLQLFAGYSHSQFSRDPGQFELHAGLNRYGDTRQGQQVIANLNQRLINSFNGLASDFRGGLYDYSAMVGLDWGVGEHSLVMEYGFDRDAIDGSAVNSLFLQWMVPLSASLDMRLVAGRSDTRAQGALGFFGVGLLLYR